MDINLSTALVAGASAIAGGLISSVVGPWIRHRLEQSAAAADRRRRSIANWRTMILNINSLAVQGSDPKSLLQVHSCYLSLEPYLSESAKSKVYSDVTEIVEGQALMAPLGTLSEEVSRIEKEWKLR